MESLEEAVFLYHTGRASRAMEIFEKLLEINPTDELIHRYLHAFMYAGPEYTHKQAYEAHCKWGGKLAKGEVYKDYPERGKRLRIGYTNHFVTNSTATTLLIPFLKAHNRDRVEVFMYSDEANENVHLQDSVEHWKNTHGMSDSDFCDLIRKDKIDVLMELNGHCLINRYTALSRKPALAQVNYFNYSSTCGVPGIDFIMVGEEVGIDDLQPYYSEKIFHKKGVQLATVIGNHFPPVSPPPFINNGHITFGSFNQIHKVSYERVKIWCDILKKVPKSRFYMKASAFEDEKIKSVYADYFKENGINLKRVTLEAGSPYGELLECYSKVDIALDTYPFGAGTTTVEATIQGVPVIAQEGERFCSKHGHINLFPIGHSELIAKSEEEYIEKAVALANNPAMLFHYRTNLRRDFQNSPRTNMKQFITDLEDACHEMYELRLTEIKANQKIAEKV